MQDDAVDERRHDYLRRAVDEKSDEGGPVRPARPDDCAVGWTSLRRDDVDDAAAATGAELDDTGGEREQRVVAAAADVVAGVEVGAALADDDLAGVDRWPPKRFTPSRWELESRPLRVDEAPFLCAMERAPTSRSRCR